jgi:hypothetical protein
MQVHTIMNGRRRRLVVGAVAAGFAVGVTLGITSAGSASTKHSHMSAARTHHTLHQQLMSDAAPPDPVVASILTSFAQTNGDANPTSMQMVATDRTSALAVLSPGVTVAGGSTPVYALTATGNFTAYVAKVPPGSQLPTGTTLWMIVDAQDPGVLLDWGVTNLTPDLSSLGTPTSL